MRPDAAYAGRNLLPLPLVLNQNAAIGLSIVVVVQVHDNAPCQTFLADLAAHSIIQHDIDAFDAITLGSDTAEA